MKIVKILLLCTILFELNCAVQTQGIHRGIIAFHPSKGCDPVKDFKCSDGQCIPIAWKCNREINCKDGSDEIQHICHSKCRPNELQCANKNCIPISLICDGDNDCGDHSDELDCLNHKCNKDQFTCKNRYCINSLWRCNGVSDCSDGSDEVGCGRYSEIQQCKPTEYLCRNTHHCIYHEFVCDGRGDCPEDDDEIGCTVATSCQKDQFECDDGTCLPKINECSGKIECPDGSDESNCSNKTHCDEKYFFNCGNGMCIIKSKVCDKHPDCPDSSDELPSICEKLCTVNNGGCSHTCKNTTNGHYCECNEGYKLINRTICEDVNECDDPSKCSQGCTNTIGSFVCTCNVGYVRDPRNPENCRIIGGQVPILYCTHHEIKKTILHQAVTSVVTVNTTTTYVLDYLYKTNTVYWCDNLLKKIVYAPIDGSKDQTAIYSEEPIRTFDLAIDWIYDHIYWINQQRTMIKVSNLDGTISKTLDIDGISEAHFIVLNPQDGWMYYIDFVKKVVNRVGMDGTQLQTIAEHLNKPAGLTLDIAKKRVYWTDSTKYIISSCNYDGSKRQNLLPKSDYMTMYSEIPTSISIFEDWIYWVDNKNSMIFKVNKLTGESIQKLIDHSLINRILAVKVYHRELQPEGINHCDMRKNKCSHLCLPTPIINSSIPMATCHCPKGFTMMSNGYTCHNDEVITTTPMTAVSNQTRKGNSFQCDINTNETRGNLIPLSWVCDGKPDCPNHRDEDDCKKTEKCGTHQFTCGTGECIPLNNKCDEISHCFDNSDELNCHCGKNSFKCNDGTCIPSFFICDGDYDCYDGSDEKNCTKKIKATRPCYADELACNDGTCFYHFQLCDGEKDCSGGEDEDHTVCTGNNDECESHEFKCDNGECIPDELKCSGYPECDDSSDEKNCTINENNKNLSPYSCDVNNGGCEHICVQKQNGDHVCKCLNGFELIEDECQDIDECTVSDVCPQICTNTNGSYTCDCYPEYISKNNGECKASIGHTAFIATERHRISLINLDKNEIKTIINETKSSYLVDYAFKRGLIFWSDTMERNIFRASMDGSGVKKIFSNNSVQSHGLAIDWIYEHIYWTDIDRNTISVSDFNGDFRTVLIKTNHSEPRSIVVNPTFGLMFWIEYMHSGYTHIKRAGMDGSRIKTIISTEINFAKALTLDLLRNKIYWVDQVYHMIFECDSDGMNRKKIVYSHENIKDTVSITTFEDWIYWSEGHKSIYKINIMGNGEVIDFPIFHTPKQKALSIVAYHQYRQPEPFNYCLERDTPCSHLCLPTSEVSSAYTRTRCVCPDDYISSNDTHCIKDPNLTTTTTTIPESLEKDSNSSTTALIISLTLVTIILIGLALYFSYKYYMKNYTSTIFHNPIYRKGSDESLTIEKQISLSKETLGRDSNDQVRELLIPI